MGESVLIEGLEFAIGELVSLLERRRNDECYDPGEPFDAGYVDGIKDAIYLLNEDLAIVKEHKEI